MILAIYIKKSLKGEHKMVDNRTKNAPETEQELKAFLKKNLPEEIYNDWIENFIFEKIDSEEIIAEYYGSKALQEFNKDYKDEVFALICSYMGEVSKFTVQKNSGKVTVLDSPAVQKKIEIAKLFVISAIFAAIVFLIIIVMFSYIGNRNFHETFYSVSSLKVDSEIRIIQLSDLHNCSYGKDNKKLLERITKLEPDVIICTGDMLDSGKDRPEEVIKLCSELSQIAPSYYIYGNNEVEKVYGFALSKSVINEKFGFTDDNYDTEKILKMSDDFEEKLEKAGVNVLKNEMDNLSVGTTDLEIFGILTSNPSAFWDYTGDTFGEYISKNPNSLKITAVHEPFVFQEFEVDSWGDLMVCGHTHGGTVRVPVFGPLFTKEGGLFPERNGEYIYGRYDVSGRPLIVSSGLENTNMLRVNNEPEVVIIDVNKF